MTRGDWRRLALLILVPLSVWGQQSAAGAAQGHANPPAPVASIFGEGTFLTPSPDGPVGARNLLSFAAVFSTGYDDNVAQTNANRLADTNLVISPRIALSREDGPLAIDLRYAPTLLVYRRQSAYNEQDHDLDLDARYRATDGLGFRLQTNVVYRSGLLESLSASAMVPAPESPGLLNDTIVTPFANQFEDNSRADVSYAISPRGSLGVFTTYTVRTFAKSAALSVPLYQTEGESVGAQYLYRTGPRSTLGLAYLYDTFHTGAGTRVGLNVPTFSWTLALTPQLQMNLFGGPVYSRMQGVVLDPLAPQVTVSLPYDGSAWHWAAGGAITFAAEKTLFRVDGSRRVTDGGGLLDGVTSDVIEETFERRLTGTWRVQWSAGWQRNVAIDTAAAPGRLEGEYGRVVILHRISQPLTAGLGYQYQRQQIGGAVALGANFDRTFAYFTLTYRFKDIPLGR